MTTKDYVKKYNLTKSGFIKEEPFKEDLFEEFKDLLTKVNPKKNLRLFEQCVKMIRDKFNAINNKTNGFIHYNVWNAFNKDYVAKLRKEYRKQSAQIIEI